MTYLEKARGYCLNARPADFSPEGLRAEPTEFYSGASGYARATMGLVIEALERHIVKFSLTPERPPFLICGCNLN